MFKYAEYIFAIVILLIIIIVSYYSRMHFIEFLPGFWEGNSDFLKEANLSDMKLFISKDFAAYLLVVDTAGNILVNMPTELECVKYKGCMKAAFSKKNEINLSFGLKELSSDRIRVKLSVTNGTMIFIDSSGSILAYLEKNTEQSLLSIDI